jgi:polar amino acid transport system substrate-binding protein
VTAVSSSLVSELAPKGVLRAAINLGNPVLAQGTPDAPRGVTVDLARELARRVGLPLELVPFEAAGKVFAALKDDRWDVAFLAIEPVRAAEIAFTEPYVIIEGVYVVRVDSALRSVADIDRPGIRVALETGSAYDLFLTRTLKAAELVRAHGPNPVFAAGETEVLAGVKQPMVEFVAKHPGTRMIDGRFMEIRQAMGTPQGRDLTAKYLGDFVEEMKASGFVAEGLKRSNQPDATVAPPRGK